MMRLSDSLVKRSYTHVCIVCQKTVFSNQKKQSYCSYECFQKARKERLSNKEHMKARLGKKCRVDPTGCWIYTGWVDKDGYGFIYTDGRHRRAHRVSYELYAGPIPEGMDILHSCDNPPCINPDHLRPGTPAENSKDMVAKGRTNARRGSMCGKAKLTEQQVFEIDADIRKYSEIARDYGISPSTVTNIKRRITWSHLFNGEASTK